MKIWLIAVGEPVPLFGSSDRLLRGGLLAEILARRGHDVLWWTSTMDHVRKQTIVDGEPEMTTSAGVRVQFLHGPLYTRNVSLGRLRNHAVVASRFSRLARTRDSPDLVLCSYPTLELSFEAVRYAIGTGVPVVVDIQDLWPDIFLELVPGWLRPFGRLALLSQFARSEFALRHADALLGVSDGYLQWGLGKSRRAATYLDKTFPLAYKTRPWTAEDERSLQERLRCCGVSADAPLVTFAGSFGRSYDLSTVIVGARRILDRDPEVRFVLCGIGEREREWKRLARDTPNVAFPGWLPGGELSCLLSRSMVGLAAYARGAPQGLPNKVIEYLSAGLPIVYSLPGETAQLLENHRCGMFYTPGDPESLATAVASLMGAPDRLREMREAARALFIGQYSADRVYEAMADHLDRVAYTARGSPSFSRNS